MFDAPFKFEDKNREQLLNAGYINGAGINTALFFFNIKNETVQLLTCDYGLVVLGLHSKECKRSIEKSLGDVFPKIVSSLSVFQWKEYSVSPLFTGAIVNDLQLGLVKRALVDEKGNILKGNIFANCEQEIFSDENLDIYKCWYPERTIPPSTLRAAFVYWNVDSKLADMNLAFLTNNSAIFQVKFNKDVKSDEAFPNLKFADFPDGHPLIRDGMREGYNKLLNQTHVAGVFGAIAMAGVTLFGFSKLSMKTKKLVFKEIGKKAKQDKLEEKQRKKKQEEDKKEAEWAKEELARQRREEDEDYTEEVYSNVAKKQGAEREPSKAEKLRKAAKMVKR
jgi:hypothetical protein